MSNYSLQPVKDFKVLDENSNYLVLFGVNNTPPHIGFVYKGKYYSNNSRGGKQNYDFSKILRSINRKKVPTLLISIKMKQIDPDKFFQSEPLSIGESCLSPIKSMLSEVGIPLNGSAFVFDMLDELAKKDQINRIEHLFCTKLITDNIITLEKYTQVEIDEAIREAKRLC